MSNQNVSDWTKELVILTKFESAQTSAIILSLIETAKRNNLDPEKYIAYLLDNLPNEETLTDKERLSAYLRSSGSM